MKKNVLLALAMVLFATSSVSAQSFLKKVGDAAKKMVSTEEPAQATQATKKQKDEYLAPLSVKIESLRIIGDKLMVSGKVQASEEFRITKFVMSMITPDGETYKSYDLWWGGKPASTTTFDLNFIPGINYAFDYTFDIKSKNISQITLLNLEGRNQTAGQNFTISAQNLPVPSPINPELSDPSTVEIAKNIYLKWTSAEEKADGLRLNYILINKNDDDQTIQFKGYSNKATIIDTSGSTIEARNSLEQNVTLPSGIPVAGTYTIEKPLKVSQIALFEFATRHFNYRLKGIVIPPQE